MCISFPDSYLSFLSIITFLIFISFITYLVNSHALTTKRTARSTQKQMQNNFKHCVLRIPSYIF